MADINVYDSLDIQEASYQTSYLASVNDAVSIADSASMERSIAALNEQTLLPFNETLIFNGEILQSHDRTEQRIAWRCGIPDRRFFIKLVLESADEISQFENKLHKWLKRSWAFPLWQFAESHNAAITAGDSSISTDTTYSGYQMNGFAMIWQDRDTYDLVTIGSFTDTTLNLKQTPANTYTDTKYIMPCVSARCLGARLKWMQDRALVDMTFREERAVDVIDFAADMIYDGKVVLSSPPIGTGKSADYNYDPDFAVLDVGTGLFDIVSNSDFNIVTQPFMWHCDTKAEAWYLRQLFHYINGQQKGLLVPTFRNDIQLSRPVGSGDTGIYVNNLGIYDNLGSNDFRTYIAFRPSGSDIIVRKVTSIDAVSSSEDKITIDAAPGDSFDANDYLCWVDLCRLSDQAVNIKWYNRGRCFVEVGLTRIKTYDDTIIEPYVYDGVGAADSNSNIMDWGINQYDSVALTDNSDAMLDKYIIGVDDDIIITEDETVGLV